MLAFTSMIQRNLVPALVGNWGPIEHPLLWRSRVLTPPFTRGDEYRVVLFGFPLRNKLNSTTSTLRVVILFRVYEAGNLPKANLRLSMIHLPLQNYLWWVDDTSYNSVTLPWFLSRLHFSIRGVWLASERNKHRQALSIVHSSDKNFNKEKVFIALRGHTFLTSISPRPHFSQLLNFTTLYLPTLYIQ